MRSFYRLRNMMLLGEELYRLGSIMLQDEELLQIGEYNATRSGAFTD